MKAEADREGQVGAEKAERNSADAAIRAEADVATRTRTKAEVATTSLMEAVVERGNLKLAYQRVVENKGAAGVDELTVSELKDHLFLGYSMTWHQKPKLRIATTSLERLTDNVRVLLRGARGRSLATTIQTLNPVLRGWAAYFKLADTRRALEERDGWIRHKLRCVLWRQWKRRSARVRNLMQRGLPKERAWRSARNGRGPWWNAGASHMHVAFPKSWFDHLGLVSLLDTVQRLQRIS